MTKVLGTTLQAKRRIAIGGGLTWSVYDSASLGILRMNRFNTLAFMQVV